MNKYYIDTDKLCANVDAVRMAAGGVPVWAVLKGDGYGLGLVPIALLMRQRGIDRFCVSTLREAYALRSAGLIKERILMLTPIRNPQELGKLLKLAVIFTVACAEDVAAVRAVALESGETAAVHIKIDTGMGRFGFKPTDIGTVLQVYTQMPAVQVTGIYTHFANAASHSKTRRQYNAFRSVLRAVAEAGFERGEAHCCNSEAFYRYPQMCLDGIRIGSAFLGRMAGSDYGLFRIGECRSNIVAIHELKCGEVTGYGSTWRAKRDTRLAIVPVGWYHGFGISHGRDAFGFCATVRTVLSDLKSNIIHRTIEVIINGTPCLVRGHIGMLHTAVDVTLLDCRVGDTAVLDISPLMVKGMESDFINLMVNMGHGGWERKSG